MIPIITEEYIFEMAKLTKKYASTQFGDFGEFIYFSHKNSTHGPRIKFYGGTKETSKTHNAPTISFDINGNTKLEDLGSLNKKNCPNAFDKEYLSKVNKFIRRTLPILLLVWFDKLDEADALEYFKGNLTLEEIISCIYDVDDNVIEDLKTSETLKDLHNKCLNYNLYHEGR